MKVEDSRSASETRRRAVARTLRRLERVHPRLQMSLIVLLTGASGLATSYLLLEAGVWSMGARYPLAVGCAYVVFLLLLALWLWTHVVDWLDSGFDIPGGTGLRLPSRGIDFSGAGGEAGGAGASGSFDVASTALVEGEAAGSVGDAVGDVAGGVGDVVGSADEGAVPLAVVMLAMALSLSLIVAMGYIVYLAPTLFAEMMVDSILSATLYRRMRELHARHWLAGVVRRTIAPFALVAILLGLIGVALQSYAPKAHTLGQVLEQARQPVRPPN